MLDKQLVKKCKKLVYSNSNNLCKDVYESTSLELKRLYAEYGIPKVLATLSSVWSFEKAVTFFNVERRNEGRNKPRTIATVFHRGYGGGVERVNAELMALWVKMGYKVIFFSREEENPLDYPYPESVKRIVIPDNDICARLEKLQSHCVNEQVDLFVYHDWTNTCFVWECMLMRMLNISVVLYCHGHFSWCFSNGRYALYQSDEFKLCNLIISLSETNARFYQMCGCNSYVAHNPIPRDLKNIEKNANRDKNHILLVGRISHEKYPMEAMQIFKNVHDTCPDAILDVVGTGDQALIREMQQFAAENRLSTSVIFHGIKSVDEISQFYNSCGCVLFTSKMEGYPMIVLETKAYGVPLIMYEMPYLSLIKDGLGVLTAPLNDVDGMSNNIISLLQNETVRIRMEREAKESFNNLLAINHQANWEDIIAISCENKDVCTESYFRADALSDNDRYILPVLIDKMKRGYDNNLLGSREYRIGKKILSYPRFAKHIIKRILCRY